MAGDWIKMRGGLFQSPKLIAMARCLHESREFRDWLTPGGSGPMCGQIVSDHALRCVTGALLTVTWSWSREFGKQVGDDCFLPYIGVSDLDDIAGAPGVGDAMAAVGWAKESDQDTGVILPNFFDSHNIPITAAERQRAYRERKKTAQCVTQTCNTSVSNVAPEKRREENRDLNPPNPPLQAKGGTRILQNGRKTRRPPKRPLADIVAEQLGIADEST